MHISLEKKVAIVTGAASGIGLAITRRFLECGVAGLVAVDRQSATLNELRACQAEFRPEARLHTRRRRARKHRAAIHQSRHGQFRTH